MRTGILLLNFGEPERADFDTVVSYLEAIFAANFRLEHAADPEAGRRRARKLAERRAPGLIEDYELMGESPLRRQTRAQACALEEEFRRRGNEFSVSVGMQFTKPSIEGALGEFGEAGVERIIALPMYPLCGPSTTVFALETVRRAIRAADWPVELTEISGWHARDAYTDIRTRSVARLCAAEELDLTDPATSLVFSAHGTPIRYLDEGSRYDLYVQNHCAALAAGLGAVDTVLGFQNHANRPGVEWTQPEIGDALHEVEGETVVVVPVSFMQEQSETLVELDIELRAKAQSLGLAFHRVPIPHDDATFASFLADLVWEALTADPVCRCRPGAFCLNHGLSR